MKNFSARNLDLMTMAERIQYKMIKSFSFRNYKLFKGEVAIDFSTVDQHRSRKLITSGEYNKVIAIYGGPSSGKSIILDALHKRSEEIDFKADAEGEIETFHLDDISVEEATQIYIDNPKILKFTVGVLQKSDLGITDVVIGEDGNVIFEHGEFDLPMESVSSGTMRLYCIMIGIYRATRAKGIVLWDERCILHPLLVRAIIDSFCESNAQMIIATNISLDWMTESGFFDQSQLYIAENNNSGSSVRRVDKMRRSNADKLSLSNNLFINSL